jgi:hypothetical protein
MCVWIQKDQHGVPAWGGPGTPVVHPQGVILHPIEVAACYDLSLFAPDTTLPGTPERDRPRGGLLVTQEIKEAFVLPLDGQTGSAWLPGTG